VTTTRLRGPLADRLSAAGVREYTDPVLAWRRLREAEGRRATGIDLYTLAAAPRGLAAHELPREERVSLAAVANLYLWPGFSVTASSDRDRDPLKVVDYDPAWPGQYARWHERLAAALGASALRIEHVGSTAVPGLAAKPVIDVQVSVAALADESGYVPPLAAAGVQLRSRDDLHRFFRPGADKPRDVHVHVCSAGSEWEREHLLFRDFLRAHPAAAGAYADAKGAAAGTWRDDRWAYTEAKTGIVLDTLESAERWARATGWTPAPRPGPDGAR
jgi:GrpB-like predicted nucleotidyltransferase (UPF0157 family)